MKKNNTRVVSLIVVLMFCIMLFMSGCAKKKHTPRVYGMLKFCLENEFSFGGTALLEDDFVLQKYPFTTNRYPDRYDIVFENDIAFQPTIDEMQRLFDKYKHLYVDKFNYLYEPEEMRERFEIPVQQTLRGMQTMMGWGCAYNSSKAKDTDYYKTLQEGTMIEPERLKVVHEVYKVGDYYAAFISNWSYSEEFKDTLYYYCQTLIHKEGWEGILSGYYTAIAFDYTEPYLFRVLHSASIEELSQLASHYQSIHKEIVTAWLTSEAGEEYHAQFN